MAHPKLQAVRERYSYRCGYCGVTEEDAGGELVVDHFHHQLVIDGSVVGLQARIMVTFRISDQPDLRIEFVVDTRF